MKVWQALLMGWSIFGVIVSIWYSAAWLYPFLQDNYGDEIAHSVFNWVAIASMVIYFSGLMMILAVSLPTCRKE